MFGCEIRFVNPNTPENGEQKGIFLGYITRKCNDDDKKTIIDSCKYLSPNRQEQQQSTKTSIKSSTHRHSYLCLLPNSKMIVLKNVKFFENNFPNRKSFLTVT